MKFLWILLIFQIRQPVKLIRLKKLNEKEKTDYFSPPEPKSKPWPES